MPFDIWHVTYALEGPAVVFNLSTDVGGVERWSRGRPGEEKYRRAAPLEVAAFRDGHGHGYVGCSARRPCRSPGTGRPGAPRTDWLQSLLAPGESLADLHLYASPSRLAAFQRLAWEAYGQCWPHTAACGHGRPSRAERARR